MAEHVVGLEIVVDADGNLADEVALRGRNDGRDAQLHVVGRGLAPLEILGVDEGTPPLAANDVVLVFELVEGQLGRRQAAAELLLQLVLGGQFVILPVLVFLDDFEQIVHDAQVVVLLHGNPSYLFPLYVKPSSLSTGYR